MDWYLTLWLHEDGCYRFRIESGAERAVCSECICHPMTTRPVAKKAMWEFWQQLRNAATTH